MSFGAVETPEQEKRPYNISAVDTSSNQENIVVPYIAGVAKCPVDWIAPIYNHTTKKVKQQGDAKGKGSGGASQQKNHYGDIAGITNVCPDDAPNDAILFIFVNDEVAFTGPLARAPGQHYVPFSIPKYCQSCRFYWGTKDQPLDNLVLYPRQDAIPVGVNPRDISTWPRLNSLGEPVDEVTELPGVANPRSGHYDFHGAYRNQGLFVARQFFFGSSPNMPSVVIVLARGTKFFAGARFEAGETGVSPMGPAFEILTDEPIGAGIPETRLVAATFQDTADAMDEARLALAPAFRQATAARSLFADYFQYYDGWARRSGSSIEFGFFDHGDIDVAALQEIASDALIEQPKIKPGDLADTKNSFFTRYTNRAKWWKENEDTEGYIDQANFERVGIERDQHLDRPHIIDGDIATRHNVEYGKIFALELATGSVSCRRDRINGLKPGKRFKSSAASLNLSFVWRVKASEKPSDRTGAINFTLEAERGIAPVPYYPPAAPKLRDFEVKPAGVEHARIVELPSGLKDSSAIQAQVLWERPSNDILGLKVHVSIDNDLYTLTRTQHHYAVRGKLAVAYSAAGPDLDTTLGLIVDMLGVDLDTVGGQIDAERDDNTLLAWINNEIFSIGDRTALGNGRFQFLNRRALYGTAKANHFVDAEVWFIYRDWLERIEDKNFAPGTTRYFKLQPYIIGGDYDIELVAEIPFTFAGGAVSAISNLQLTTSARVAAGRIESRIAATWEFALDQDIFAFEVAIKRTADATWQYRTVNTPATDWEVAPSTSYDVRVRPINSHGEPGEWCDPETILSASISPFSVTGLEIDGQGNDTEWRERDLKLACRLNSPSSGINVGGTIQTGVQDPAFAYLLWQIFVGGVNVYEEQTVVPKFQFTEAKSEAAFLRINGTTGKFGLQGQPLTINVYAVDSLRNVSAPAILTVQNSVPVAPGDVDAQAGPNRTVLLTWTNGPETDREATEVYRGTVNDPALATKVGTIPAANDLFVDPLLGLSGDVTLFYWLKAVDTFGNKSPFSVVASATSSPIAAPIADIDAVQTTLSNIFDVVILREGAAWTPNTPTAGSIAWNAQELVHKGVTYPVDAGNTALKYVYWVVGDGSYTPSNTQLDILPGSNRYLIAQNAAGTPNLLWKFFANAVIGNANILSESVLDSFIKHLSADKIIAGIILGQEIVLRNDGTSPGMIRSYDYVAGVSGFKIGMDGAGNAMIEINTGLFRGGINVAGKLIVDQATGLITVGPLKIRPDGSFTINEGANSFNVDKDGRWWIGAAAFEDAPIRSDNQGNALANSLTLNNPIIYHTHPAPTFTNDFTGDPIGDLSYTDNDDIAVRAHGVSGKRMRFTVDGSEVTPNSPFWPDYPNGTAPGTGPDNFVGFVMGLSGFSGIFRARVASGPNWDILGEEGSIRLTHVALGGDNGSGITAPSAPEFSMTGGNLPGDHKTVTLTLASGATGFVQRPGVDYFSVYNGAIDLAPGQDVFFYQVVNGLQSEVGVATNPNDP